MTRFLGLALAACLVLPVHAQVRQSGNVTPTHAAAWTTSGTIQDAGTAANPFLTTFGVQGPICVISGPISGAYQQFCLQTSLAGGAVLSTQNLGGASSQGLSFNINGTISGIPLINLPTIAGDYACFLNTTGTLTDCGAIPIVLPSADIFVGNASNIAIARALSGDATITNTGVITVATVGGLNPFNSTNQSSGTLPCARMPALTGDVTTSAGSCADTIAAGAVTNAKVNAAAAITAGKLAYIAAGGGGVSRSGQSKWSDVTSALDYGAVADCSTDNTAAIQLAVNSITAGGTLFFPTSCFNAAGPITITSPMTIRCGGNFLNASSGNINMSSTTANLFVVNSNYVNFEDCYINGEGTPTTNQAIVVGTDSKTITDGTCTNASATFTSTSQANFTSADIGKRLNATNCATGPGPLFVTILSINSTTSIQMSANATCGGSCPGAGVATAKYGPIYLGLSITNTQIVNFGIGVHLIDAAQTRSLLLYALNNIDVQIEDQLSPDFGNNYITSSYLLAPDTTTGHIPVVWNSGGETYLFSTKIINGQYGVKHASNVGLTGVFQMIGGGIENCGTSALLFSESAQFNDVLIQGAELSCGNPVIAFDNSSSALVSTATIGGVTFQGGGGTAIAAGKVNNLTATGNTLNTGGGNPGISATSNATACMFATNNMIGTTVTYTSASATCHIDDMNGVSFANLPSAAAVGSRMYCSDCAAGATCAGSGGGTFANRVVTASPKWTCSP